MMRFNDWKKKNDETETTTDKNINIDMSGSLPVFVLEPPNLETHSTIIDTSDEINIEDNPDVMSVPHRVRDYLSNRKI